MPFLTYLTRRLGVGLVQVVAVVVVVLCLVQALPGDAADTRVSADSGADPAEIRTRLGLDRPFLDRLGAGLAQLARGDLGQSLHNDRPVSAMLATALPVTGTLAVVTLAVLVPLVLGLGVWLGCHAGSRIDEAITTLTMALYAIPDFVIAILLVAVLALEWGLIPPTALGIAEAHRYPELLLLPVLVLLLKPLAGQSRILRAGVSDAMNSPYVAHARRLGIPGHRLRWRHALPNALPATVQQMARVADYLLGGAIVVETIYALPGLGQLMATAVRTRDIPVIQGVVICTAIATVLINALADIAVQALTPAAGR